MINISESALHKRIHAVWVDGLDLWAENPSLHQEAQDAALRLAQVFESRIGRSAHVTEPADYTHHVILCVAADAWSPPNRGLSISAGPARERGCSAALNLVTSPNHADRPEDYD